MNIDAYYSKKAYIELENCLFVFRERARMIKSDPGNIRENGEGLQAACEQMSRILNEFKTLVEYQVAEK